MPGGEEHFRTIFEHAAVGLADVALDGRILHANERLCQIFGYSRQELLRLSFQEIIHPEELDRATEQFQRLLAGALAGAASSYSTERRYMRKDGTVVWVKATVSLVRSADGEPTYLIAAFEDITAQKHAEDALRHAHHALEQRIAERDVAQRERDRLFELSQDLLAIATFDGYLLDVNPAVVAFAGVPRDEVLATPFRERIHPDDRSFLNAAFERLSAGEPSASIEVRGLHHGDWHWTAWRVTAIPAEGKLYGVGRDIHAQHLAEERLRQSQKIEAMGQLTGGIAHDINNILTAVIGNLDRIATRSARDDPRRRFADAAMQSAERASRLIRQLLAFARRQRLQPKALRLQDELQNRKAVLRHAAGPAVSLATTIPKNLWSCRADPAPLEAALLNLVINARDAMGGSGKIRITARNATIAAHEISELAPGEYVLLSVTDTGRGMTPEEYQRAFEPFFTTKKAGQGTGLGLSMVYGFAKQSGGLARIDSKLGAGTSVHLYLPRATEPPKGSNAVEPAPAKGALIGATILVVEDTADVRQVMVEALQDAGHQVLLAGSAAEALAILEGGEPVNLVLSDIVMQPGMDGVELAKEIRRRWPHVPVLLTTGYTNAVDPARTNGTAFDVLLKPYRPAQLRAKVQQMLDRSTRLQAR